MRSGALLLVFAAVLAAAQNLAYRPDPGWQPPPAAVSRPNPLAGKTQYAAGGRKLFQRECVTCHGPQGQGLLQKNAANLQLPVVQQQSDGALFWKITNGNPRRGMPPFSGLPEMQRWQLVLFLRTLAPAGEAKTE
jgi:mono/diheme cytochrome c family protein